MTAGPIVPGSEAGDPGPPPEKGLSVRPDGEGFHARVWPRPEPPWGRWAVGGVAALAVGGALSVVVAEGLEVRLQVAAAAAAFLALLGLAPFARAHVPAEISMDDHQVYWNGERFPSSAVRGARVEGHRLVLVGEHGPLAHLEHLPPDVATWLARAIRASVSGSPAL